MYTAGRGTTDQLGASSFSSLCVAVGTLEPSSLSLSFLPPFYKGWVVLRVFCPGHFWESPALAKNCKWFVVYVLFAVGTPRPFHSILPFAAAGTLEPFTYMFNVRPPFKKGRAVFLSNIVCDLATKPGAMFLPKPLALRLRPYGNCCGKKTRLTSSARLSRLL